MSERKPDPAVVAFCERLAKLDAGERARLKRNAGMTLAEARGTLGIFWKALPPSVTPADEDTYYLVATLYPLADAGGTGNLGAALSRAHTSDNGKGLDRRMQILLDAEGTQLAFRLRQAIRFLASNRLRVNWPVLLEDLLRWTHPARYVQRDWAHAYYVGNTDHTA
jgi:CRISPR type I-E-associated protein CasB/Cse2